MLHCSWAGRTEQQSFQTCTSVSKLIVTLFFILLLHLLYKISFFHLTFTKRKVLKVLSSGSKLWLLSISRLLLIRTLPSNVRLWLRQKGAWRAILHVFHRILSKTKSSTVHLEGPGTGAPFHTGSPAWNLVIWLLCLRLRMPWFGHNEVWNSVILLTWTRPDIPPPPFRPFFPPHTTELHTLSHNAALPKCVLAAICKPLNYVNCS